MFSIITFSGSIAFITSVIGLFPQLYKVMKTRSTADISMLMLINYFICSLAWIIYGAYTASLYVQLANILGIVSCALLILIKYRFDRKKSLYKTF